MLHAAAHPAAPNKHQIRLTESSQHLIRTLFWVEGVWQGVVLDSIMFHTVAGVDSAFLFLQQDLP